MSNPCLLLKCEPVDMTTGAAAPVFLSVGAGPHTYDGHRWTDAVIDSLPTIRRDAYPVDARGLGGRSIPSFGALALTNDRHAQDLLVRRAWDGRPITVWRGEVGAPFSTFTKIFAATTDQPTFDGPRLSVPIRDQAALFQRPVLTEAYAGTGGFEGTAAMGGTKKPRILGRPAQFEPVLVDPPRFLYQIASQGIGSGGLQILEDGRPFTLVTMTTPAALEAWMDAPEAGKAAVHHGTGYFALGAPPQGVITVTAGLGLFETHAGAVLYVLQQLLNFDFRPALDLAALSELGVALPGTIGMYLREGDRALDSVLDEIGTSAGAWWGLTALGMFTMRQWAWRTPVVTLREDRRHFLSDLKAEPVDPSVSWLTLNYGRQYRPLTDLELAGVAGHTADDLARLKAEWAGAVQYRTDDTTTRLLARKLTIDTLYGPSFSNASAAVLVMGRLLAANRWRLATSVRMPFGTFTIGDTVRLQTSRYGFDGTDWLVFGTTDHLAQDPEREYCELRLWGPRGAGE